MILTNRLADPGDTKRVILRPNTVEVLLANGEHILYRRVTPAPVAGSVEGSVAGSVASKDKVIADNIRDHWRHQRSRAG